MDAAPEIGSRLRDLVQAFVAARHSLPPVRFGGRVAHARSSHYQVAGIAPHVRLGDCVEFEEAGALQLGQVVRIDAGLATITSFEDRGRLGLGQSIWKRGRLMIAPDASWKGRVVDALARPIDGMGALPQGPSAALTDAQPPDPLRRQRITKSIRTGVAVVDLFTPLCAGQRLGIFAGSGVGKSTLLGMLARSVGFDSIVIALVGERGREVREFIDDILGTALARSVVVVATGDESAMLRRQAPNTAMRIAEHLRDCGESVLLVVDSITRYAHALREVALASGEPPVARGYTPSVFADLPRLLERAGPGVEGGGTVTGIFSVLVDGDDHNEPVADAVRGTLDGHIVLDRAIAGRGQYPAVNVLHSVSRLADLAWTEEQRRIARQTKAMIAEYEDTRDLRAMGAYKPGMNPELDKVVRNVPRLYEFLAQTANVQTTEDVFQVLAARMASWT